MIPVPLADRCPGSGCNPDEWTIEEVKDGRVVRIREPATEVTGFCAVVYRECPFCGRMFNFGAYTLPRIRKRKRIPVHRRKEAQS